MRCVDCLPLIEEYFDGEVEERVAEQMGAHLSSCADCTAALDALSFEQEVYARYDRGIEVSPALWARVSAEIAREPLREARTEKRPFLTIWLELFAAAFSTLAARPALASSLALLLVGVTAGSLWFAYVRRATHVGVASNTPPAPGVRATAPPSADGGGKNPTAAPSASPVELTPTRGGESSEVAGVTSREKPQTYERRDPPRDTPLTEDELNRIIATKNADAGIVNITYDPHAEVSPTFVKISGDDAGVVTTDARLLDPEQKEVARHVEQAQMLLRSIKNARAESSDTFNVAYEKKLSRKLLSENATLQLDAETRGDKDTKQVLDRIEPYLLDIANMHDNASREEVRSIRERIDRKEIIAALQVY